MTMTSAAASSSVCNQVAAATLASLNRIAGGGFSAMSPAADDVANDAVNKTWGEELMRIAHSSVSFTNNKNGSNGGEIAGKPHDMEVRAALMLYHRIHRYHCVRPKKRKKSEAPLPLVSNPPIDEKEWENNGSSLSLEIISDLGTRRKIDSINSLASLLALELESELTGDALPIDDISESEHAIIHDDRPTDAQPAIFTDIRCDASGIICLLTLRRSNQLYSHGRIPCPNCINWFKGSKGLWWHQLSVHGNQYSSATEVAAGVMNSSPIIPYNERNANAVRSTETVGIFNCKNDTEAENEAFVLIKVGNYDEFTKLIEANNLTMATQLDRNGASLIHWAAGSGRIEFVTYLVEKCNCDPNQRQRGKKSFMGRTPLHWASRNGHLNIVKYLISNCNVDVDAKTYDGTTALCWASWQGHLEIMKCLHENGADVYSTNKFGCNALLWSAQGKCTVDIMTWLFESGLDFNRINTNGHSALHKAAQRGNTFAVRWLVHSFLSESTTGRVFIHPDREGNCPSDLCGMEGHEDLAVWISAKECECISRLVRHATSVEDLLEIYSSSILSWLVKDLHGLVACKTNDISSVRTGWGPGNGVRRMSLAVMEQFVSKPAAQNLPRTIELGHELNDID